MSFQFGTHNKSSLFGALQHFFFKPSLRFVVVETKKRPTNLAAFSMRGYPEKLEIYFRFVISIFKSMFMYYNCEIITRQLLVYSQIISRELFSQNTQEEI